VGNEDHVARYGLPGDQHVVRADPRSFGGQHGSDLTRLPGVLFVELEHDKLKSIDQRQVLRRPPAPERAVKQLVRDDGGDRISLGLSRRAHFAVLEVVSFSKAMTAFASRR
jgi:hypothetical protein